ncbi:MAG: hypothetical protein QW688_09545 [Thermoprotei archaeon]
MQRGMVGTVGHIRVFHNVTNVVAGGATITVIRCLSLKGLEDAVNQLISTTRISTGEGRPN